MSTNTKDLDEKLTKLEQKLDKKIIEHDWILSCYKHLEKHREKLLEAGCTVITLDAYDKAIQPIKQRACEIKNFKQKLQKAREEQQQLEKAERAKKQERTKALIDAVYMQPVFPYNTNCNSFSFIDGEAICEIKMDLQYCNNNCPYCTNRAGSYLTDRKGKVIGTRKRGI